MPPSPPERERLAVGYRLKLTRQALGYDQQTFARQADLSPTAYNQYESGKNMPSLPAAHALCDRYRLTLDWIYRGEPSGLRYELASAIHALQTSQSLDKHS